MKVILICYLLAALNGVLASEPFTTWFKSSATLPTAVQAANVVYEESFDDRRMHMDYWFCWLLKLCLVL